MEVDEDRERDEQKPDRIGERVEHGWRGHQEQVKPLAVLQGKREIPRVAGDDLRPPSAPRPRP